jgi:hypothetical protein
MELLQQQTPRQFKLSNGSVAPNERYAIVRFWLRTRCTCFFGFVIPIIWLILATRDTGSHILGSNLRRVNAILLQVRSTQNAHHGVIRSTNSASWKHHLLGARLICFHRLPGTIPRDLADAVPRLGKVLGHPNQIKTQPRPVLTSSAILDIFYTTVEAQNAQDLILLNPTQYATIMCYANTLAFKSSWTC